VEWWVGEEGGGGWGGGAHATHTCVISTV